MTFTPLNTWLRVRDEDLVAVAALLGPKPVTMGDGRVMQFVDPDPHRTLRAIAERFDAMISGSRMVPSTDDELLAAINSAYVEPVGFYPTGWREDYPALRQKNVDELYREVMSILVARPDSRAWQPMDSAPMDGTVIEACARLEGATSGFPQYVGFFCGRWMTASYDRDRRPVIPWCWRPRDQFWPDERTFEERVA